MSASDITASIKRNIIRFENTDTSHPKGTFTQDISYRQSLLTQTKACCPSVPEDDSYDIFVIMGQSNAVGNGNGTPDTTVVDGVMQLGRNGVNYDTIIPAVDPLQQSAGAVGIGYGVTFAKEYKSKTGRNVLLVPAAKNGSTVQEWTKSSTSVRSQDDIDSNTFRNVTLYNEAFTRTLSAFKKNPNNRLAGILWHQGEGNTSNRLDDTYTANLYSFIADFRRDLFNNGVTNALYVPWLFGEFVPSWITGVPNTDYQYYSLTDVPTGVLPTALGMFRDTIKTVASQPNHGWVTSQYISNDDPELTANGIPPPPTNAIHFNAAGQRRFGIRYYNVYSSLISKTVASIKSMTFVATSPTTLYITFVASNDQVTKYVLKLSTTAGVVLSTIEIDPYETSYTLRSSFIADLSYNIGITPYYGNSQGIEFTKSYTPSDPDRIGSLITRIYSNDNSTLTDVTGFRTITYGAVANSSRTYARPMLNTDQYGNARMMLANNGSFISLNGDIPAGSISTSAWVQLSPYMLFPNSAFASVCTVTSASGTAGVQTYFAANVFAGGVGQTVTVTGLTPAGFNVTTATVTSANSTQFTVAGVTTGTSTGTGTATGSSARPTVGGAALNAGIVFLGGSFRHELWFRANAGFTAAETSTSNSNCFLAVSNGTTSLSNAANCSVPGTTTGWRRLTNTRSDGWSHFVHTWNDTTKVRTAYIDGRLSYSDSTLTSLSNSSGTTRTTTDLINIGTNTGVSTNPNNFSVFGFMNDIRIYNKALTAAEVNNIYTLGY